MLKTYIELDTSNKIRNFIILLKIFIREQNIVHNDNDYKENNTDNNNTNSTSNNDEKTGYLSTYAWSILAVHFLLKFQILPNIHSKRRNGELKNQNSDNNDNKKDNSVIDCYYTDTVENVKNKIMLNCPTTINDDMNIENNYNINLQEISVLELLHSFFLHVSSGINIFSNVVTLRNNGEILPKNIWGKNISPGSVGSVGGVPLGTPLWRLSIEDPLQVRTAICINIYIFDLFSC